MNENRKLYNLIEKALEAKRKIEILKEDDFYQDDEDYSSLSFRLQNFCYADSDVWTLSERFLKWGNDITIKYDRFFYYSKPEIFVLEEKITNKKLRREIIKKAYKRYKNDINSIYKKVNHLIEEKEFYVCSRTSYL